MAKKKDNEKEEVLSYHLDKLYEEVDIVKLIEKLAIHYSDHSDMILDIADIQYEIYSRLREKSENNLKFLKKINSSERNKEHIARFYIRRIIKNYIRSINTIKILMIYPNEFKKKYRKIALSIISFIKKKSKELKKRDKSLKLVISKSSSHSSSIYDALIIFNENFYKICNYENETITYNVNNNIDDIINNIDDIINKLEKIKIIYSGLTNLSQKDKIIFRLHHYDKYSHSEIARISGISINSVYTKLTRVKKTIETIWQSCERELKKEYLYYLIAEIIYSGLSQKDKIIFRHYYDNGRHSESDYTKLTRITKTIDYLFNQIIEKVEVEVEKINKIVKKKRNFNCSLFCPPSALKGNEFFIQLFIHLESKLKEAQNSAKLDDSESILKGQITIENISKKKISFHLYIEGIETTPSVQTLTWNEITDSVLFKVDIPKSYPNKYLIGKVTITLAENSIPIGHIRFKIEVTENEQHKQEEGIKNNGSIKWYEFIFISYSRKDYNKIAPMVQTLSLLKYKYFIDIFCLRPGDKWEKKIYESIDRSDAFFLFWSSNADNSEFVKKEIQYALKVKKGLDNNPPEIVPVIVENPPPKPPDELKHIHFNDDIRFCMRI